MNLDYRFSFGKYKGLTLQEAYQGTLNPDRKLISLYLDKILNNRDPNIPLDPCFEFIEKFKVSENTIEIVGTLEPFDSGVNAQGEVITLMSEIEFGNIQSIISQFISYHFSDNWLGILENITIYNANQEQRSVLGGDPKYLEWCIKEVTDFKINKETMEVLKKLSISKFLGVEVILIKPNLYEYAPIIRTEKL